MLGTGIAAMPFKFAICSSRAMSGTDMRFAAHWAVSVRCRGLANPYAAITRGNGTGKEGGTGFGGGRAPRGGGSRGERGMVS
eukprot:1840220-Rhodomonas_salina.2